MGLVAGAVALRETLRGQFGIVSSCARGEIDRKWLPRAGVDSRVPRGHEPIHLRCRLLITNVRTYT